MARAAGRDAAPSRRRGTVSRRATRARRTPLPAARSSAPTPAHHRALSTLITPYREVRMNRLRPRLTGLLLLLAALPASLLITGCQAPSHVADIVVVLPSATANEPEPMLAAADRALLYHAGASSTKGVAYVINPATGQPTQVSLTPRRADGQVEYGPRRDYLLRQNVNRVQQVLRTEAATGPFDLLALISTAVRATSHPGTLLILSSGLSTAGGFNLLDVGWDANPATVAGQLRQHGLLPRLAGWRVDFSGLADVAGPQPVLPLPQRTTLTGYWMAICHTAQATACRDDDTIRPDPPSRSTTPVPVVPVPAVTAVAGPHHAAGVSVPADELFSFDSARLLAGADSILRPLVSQARAGHRLVSISGYASPDGGSATYNLALSRSRALSVRNRLLALGLPAGQVAQVAGLGTAGLTRRACYRHGQLDEAVCATMRRVVILLNPQSAAKT
jgi:outer membrane protein OmpA-like peptidoglycan-associated protein